MWTLFISICTVTGACAWFEITQPFDNEKLCMNKGSQLVEEIVKETSDRTHGEITCIKKEAVEDFKNFLRKHQEEPSPKEQKLYIKSNEQYIKFAQVHNKN